VAADPRAFARDIATRVNRVFGDRALAARLGKAGRKRAVEEFGWDAIAGQTAALYRELLDVRA
jgi:starch synthase